MGRFASIASYFLVFALSSDLAACYFTLLSFFCNCIIRFLIVSLFPSWFRHSLSNHDFAFAFLFFPNTILAVFVSIAVVVSQSFTILLYSVSEFSACTNFISILVVLFHCAVYPCSFVLVLLFVFCLCIHF